MKNSLVIFLLTVAGFGLVGCASSNTQPDTSVNSHRQMAHQLESGSSPGSVVAPEEVHQ